MGALKAIGWFSLFLSIIIVHIVSSGGWFYKAKGNKKFVEHIDYMSFVVQTTVQCAAKCSNWKLCREFGVSPRIDYSSEGDSLSCMISSGNAGCRGNESNWESFRKYESAVEKMIVEDSCKFVIKEEVAKNAASKGKYAVYCDGYKKDKPKTKTFFYGIGFQKAAYRKIEVYNFVTVGNSKKGLYNLTSPRDSFKFEKSDGVWRTACPEQAVIVEIIVDSRSEFNSGACRYLYEKFKLDKEIEVEIVQDKSSEEWFAKCPVYETGIHVMTGFQYDGQMMTHILCSLLKFK